jgi:aldehyde:ferredoxin oxidoreductase
MVESLAVNGWTGKRLRVDLSSGKTSVEEIDEE